jgi:UDP-N-acetylglucosamine--N-acetylmuramyl-(pentapeptide) pyrophosphoryl-undecaprenol N-acetylglucosamine transferase
VKVLITGGGTGGHVAPAIAVVSALRNKANDIELLYVGSEHGIESRLAAENNVRFQSVATGKMRRSANPLKMLNRANVQDAFRVPLGFLQAIKLVGAFRPDVVLSTGGYVCVPVVLAAAIRRVPVLTHEQTTTVGLANRIAGRFAQKIALTFEDSQKHLGSRLAGKSVVTGNPLRAELFSGSRHNAGRFGFLDGDSSLPLVYVTGGAQGARVINRAIADAMPGLLKHARVLHQTGTADENELQDRRNSIPPELASRWQLRAFIEQNEIGDAWASADVVVARAGAGTVTEACALSKPVVYVPLEPTSGNEQLHNAERSVDAGGAVIVRQANCNGQTVSDALLPLLTDETKRTAMAHANGSIAVPNAADRIAELLLEIATSRT